MFFILLANIFIISHLITLFPKVIYWILVLYIIWLSKFRSWETAPPASTSFSFAVNQCSIDYWKPKLCMQTNFLLCEALVCRKSGSEINDVCTWSRQRGSVKGRVLLCRIYIYFPTMKLLPYKYLSVFFVVCKETQHSTNVRSEVKPSGQGQGWDSAE